jgi:hypothetical protein
MRLERLDGLIAAAGFASGHRIVVGRWEHSPLGPFTDVMWARPPPSPNVLLAPSTAVADYIAAVYPFPVVEIVGIRSHWSGGVLEVDAGPLRISLRAAPRTWRFPPRPRLVTATAENIVARALLDVRTTGRSPTGVREWYRTRWLRWVVAGRAACRDTDLGPLAPVVPRTHFGFTEPPRRPSLVGVTTFLRR